MSTPSAEPTVSAFITIALTGSTIEPVISHSTTNVSATSSVTASGRLEAIASCWSMNSAAAPPTSTGRSVSSRMSRTSARAVSPSRLAGGEHVDLPGRRRRARAARTPRGRRGGRRGRRAKLCACGLVGGQHDGDRARVLAAEVARQGVGDGPRALRPSGSPTSRPASRSRAARAARAASISAPVTSATGSGRRITACASRYQAPCSGGLGRRRGATASFVAPERERRGRDHERGERRR